MPNIINYWRSGNATYDFQPTRTSRHSLTPLRVTFNVLQHTTKAFEEIAEQNKALYRSLQNQFIPAMEYTYTFDNAALRGVRNPIWWQTTFTSAGNITSGIYRVFGRKFSQKDKKLFGVPFAQFLKVNSDFRYTWKIDKNQSIASRVAGGIIWAYGNTNTAPYSEQFYIGGANSVRAFTARSIGPGGFRPTKTSKGLYLDQTGDIRMEANVEYRFRIYGDLHGAVFWMQVTSGCCVKMMRRRRSNCAGRLSVNRLLWERVPVCAMISISLFCV